MKNIRNLLLASILLLATPQLVAAESPGFGGRALAMGGAYTAVSDDATAAYWNPAGLMQLGFFGFTPSIGVRGNWNDAFEAYSAYNNGEKPNFGSMDAAVDGMVGLNLNGIGLNAMVWSDFQTNRTGSNLTGDGTGKIMGTMTLAQEITPLIAVGTSIKAFRERQVLFRTDDSAPLDSTRNYAQDVSATSYAVDLGGQFKLGRAIRAGAVVKNLGPKLEFEGTRRNYVDDSVGEIAFNEKQESSIAVGIAVEPPLMGVLFAVDAERPMNGEAIEYRVGVEKSFFGSLKLRAGASRADDEDLTNLSAGVGLEVGPALIDLAVLGNQDDGVNMVYLTGGILW